MAGIGTIEHGVFLTEQIATQMATQGTVLCPTLATYRILAEGAGGTIHDYAMAKAQYVVDAHRESLARALDAGFGSIAGTDAGAPLFPTLRSSTSSKRAACPE